ncbi:MAG: Wzz/FepE/Etk N-terminal domain-containing protein [Chloroflexi bacterium]|nr:Wzz/FepE/Etk N-terminal domain-containing protein [Chloroflexota bacterium]
MELSDYLRILKQRGWIIILMALLTAVAAFGFSKMQTELFESNLRLLVFPSRTDFGQAQAAKELLGSYEQWLLSSYRAQDVIDELGLDMTAPALLADVKVASDISSYVIRMTVENSNPDVANNIATAWGNLLIQSQNERNDKLRKEDRISIEFLDDARAGLASPKTKINTAAGFVFGALLGVLVVFGLEWYESGIIKRTEDVDRYLDVPVIGSIPNQ